jgi:hypothetical protein
MTPNRIIGLAVALACGLAAGCGGGAPDGAGDAAPSGQTAAVRQRDACALIDVAEIGVIAGATLTAEHTVDSPTQSSCELRDAASSNAMVSVTVLWEGGKAAADAERAGMAIARQLLNEPGVDIEELTGSGTEPGLADDAYYSNLLPSWALKGDVKIQVLSPMFNAERTRRTFIAVTKTALSRL